MYMITDEWPQIRAANLYMKSPVPQNIAHYIQRCEMIAVPSLRPEVVAGNCETTRVLQSLPHPA